MFALALVGVPSSTQAESSPPSNDVPAAAQALDSTSPTDVFEQESLGGESQTLSLTQVEQWFETLAPQAPDLDRQILYRSLHAAERARKRGLVSNQKLSVIDFSRPSTERRLWIFDLEKERLLWHELVSHGKNTGGNMATEFSNTNGSLQSSLGLFTTADTYYGKNGYSLRLHGHEPGVNDLALPRTIVIHGAPYVSDEFIARNGRLGRSWGCPALSEAVAREVIDAIKEGSLLFAHYPDEAWLGGSEFLADLDAERMAAFAGGPVDAPVDAPVATALAP